jgi:Acyl-CoA dehydrogenase, C-terminal domain
VFGKLLKDTPLHVRTLSVLAVQLRYLTHFTFYVTSLLGKVESNTASVDDRHLLRLLTPVLKATVAKLAVPFLSECMEAMGGQGYVEEGGIAVIYRDIQVNSIWEGTTNVLAHDMLRVLRGRQGGEVLAALNAYVDNAVKEIEGCEKAGNWGARYKRVYEKWRGKLVAGGKETTEVHARELVLWLGRTVAGIEMLRDAARDGDDVELECCKRVFDVKNQGWTDVKETIEWDRRIVFGDGAVSSSLAMFPARL